MKKLFVGLLLLMGVAATASLAFAQVSDENGGIRADRVRSMAATRGIAASRAAKLHTSTIVGDTTFVGYTPGHVTANNYWSIYSGYSPGTSNSPAFHRPPAQGGMWDFEGPYGDVHGDSLQGWWTYRASYPWLTAGVIDWQRPYSALERGNDANKYPVNTTGRTYGVIGVWHRDPGNAAGVGVGWAPIGGSYSAWMGLRRHGDNTVIDDPAYGGTGNAFTDDLVQYTRRSRTAPGSDNRFPGYATSMDQMLYRDIDMTGFTGNNLTISYKYRLRMSTQFDNTAVPDTRTGWFDKDPLQVTDGGTQNAATCAAGRWCINFISSYDAGDGGAPRDSFEVYVGAPAEGTFLGSDGVTHPIFDPQRRWFSEVVKATENTGGGTPQALYRQIDRDTGIVEIPVTKTVTLTSTDLAPILSTGSNKVRLVFRLHTNLGYDSQTSAWPWGGGKGAAVVDDVTYQIVGGPASAAGWGDFEDPGSIDNRVATDAKNAWKSTGKPMSTFPHTHPLLGGGSYAPLTYADLCGQPGDLTRLCNMTGVVISMGNHDDAEKIGGATGTFNNERLDMIISPTIQLCGPYTIGGKNEIGLAAPGQPNDPIGSVDYGIDYDIYTGDVLGDNEHYWWIAASAYPAGMNAGAAGPKYPTWSTCGFRGTVSFEPAGPYCYENVDYIKANGLLVWDPTLAQNGASFPDSMKIWLHITTLCWSNPSVTDCAPTGGAYYDNVSLMIVDGTPVPISMWFWNLYQDTFPTAVNASGTDITPAYNASFDTTTALVKSAYNIAPQFGGLLTYDIPGDSAVAQGAPGTHVRMDLIFRVLPGPGNYVSIGRPDLPAAGQNLALDPKSWPTRTAIAASPATNPASKNFWESYLANNGPYGTPGGHALVPARSAKIWNPNVWNSARMDTAEASGLFAFQGKGIIGGAGDKNLWQSTYHESEFGIAPSADWADPWTVTNLRSNLGISRHRCFLASITANANDIDCVHNPGTLGAGYDLTYADAAHGYSEEGTGPTATTIEGTKIIPDGLLTPGASVQYFFRREDSSVPGVAGIMPDTNTVTPQTAENNFDAHRWQYFSVLPDRWKAGNYTHPVYGTTGIGEACMLVVDWNDRRGDEQIWVGVADTIGSTRPAKWGAHNGWHAAGGQDVNLAAARVYTHGGIPGTTWDFWNIHAAESINNPAGTLGARLAAQPNDAQMGGTPSNVPPGTGKQSVQGPTPGMMDFFYSLMFLFAGDINGNFLGPFNNRSQDDVALITTWLSQGSTISANRGFWGQGNGFVEANEVDGSEQADLNASWLGVTLLNENYRLYSGSTATCPDLILNPATVTDTVAFRNSCIGGGNDVLGRSTGLLSLTSWVAKYQDGTNLADPPYKAGIKKAWSNTSPYVSYVDGFDMFSLRSKACWNSRGRARYFNEIFNNVFNGICTATGAPAVALDVPNFSDGNQFVDFMGLRNTPLVKGSATIHLGLAKKDFVEVKVFDVSGRQIRTLAARTFEPGEHNIMWDGSDDSGRQVARGVYFTQVKYRNSNFNAARKLTVLK